VISVNKSLAVLALGLVVSALASPCAVEGVKGVKLIFNQAPLAPLRAAAPRVAFERREDPRTHQAATATQ
jgi:hypothetical protein